ncbi:MAG: Eco57I restriction-modification methylase domain-containing protein [Chitinophagaceae bacterium]|nr:Eco57I restriction-modification methylase domain-containing protein [Chitinophagaceae bacterium]
MKDYFIERVVFPGIFNKESKNPGFDIVIGNPPYVNTKLISSMGISKKLEEEYGYCDDLYNHFTFRGLELLKSGGFLSYITSDTFLDFANQKEYANAFSWELQEATLSEGKQIYLANNCRSIFLLQTPICLATKNRLQTSLIPVKNRKC